MKRYGTNPVLLNVEYIRPDKKKGIEECFHVVYMDDDGNMKFSEESPEVGVYIVKPEYRNYTYNKPEERISHMDKVMVPFSEIKDLIIKESGEWGRAIKDRSKAMEDYRYLDNLYKWPYCYRCDFLPEFYFMHEWFSQYPLTYPKLSKAFMDIETDIMDYTVDLDNIRDSAYAPVNLVTVIMDKYNEAYQFILHPYKPSHDGLNDEEYKERYRLYEQQLEAHEHMMSHLDEHIKDLHDRFDSTYGNINYHIREYQKEIDLIADVFRYINTRKPAFCCIWNMRFDIPYLYYRIMQLGYDPMSIMCAQELPNKKCYFKQDNTTFEIPKQFDFFHCTSYTQYICQMRLYAAIRKSQHKLRSVALNAIGDRELKDKKVEYPENANIKTFPYDDWRLFCIYNIKDVLLQFGIERKTNDVNTYYARAMQNQTPYYKIFRETHLLRDVREIYFEEEGWSQGNNLNNIQTSINEPEKKFYGDDEENDDEDDGDTKKSTSYKGAINAEPSMNDYIGEELWGKPSNSLFSSVIDMDMGSFYPSIKYICNLDAITLLFKSKFNNEEFISGEFSNRSLNQTYEEKDKNGNMRDVEVIGEAVNTYASKNILTFGYNWLGLPSINELEQIMETVDGIEEK